MFVSLNHIDVHLRIGCSLFNIAAAIDVFNAGGRLDIHSDGALSVCKRFVILVSARIFSSVSTTHQVSYDDRS